MASSSKQGESIPITSLDPNQLMNIRTRMEEEVQSLQTSAMQLNRAASLFQSSKESIDTLSSAEEGGQHPPATQALRCVS
jgi:prefoldin subunit 5